MSKKSGILLIALIVGAAFFASQQLLYKLKFSEGARGTLVEPAAVASTFAPLLEPLVFKPVSLTIEKIGLTEIKIVEVGVEEGGRLEVPKSFDEVGWYRNGPKAGEVGNAILAGHYDRVGGSPAVFFNLVKLSAGDKITIKDEVGRVLSFEVYEVSHVKINDPNSVLRAYEESKEPILTVITCGGVWDPIARDYSKRLLIKARMLKV
ncbi:class F sortase [candidate division WWE3 bacterium]|nr:class F sortase [candidate division WWE3 bacterium]